MALKADFGHLEKVLQRTCPRGELPIFEIGVDTEIMEAFLGERLCVPEEGDRAGQVHLAHQQLRFWHAAGYDMAVGRADAPFVDQVSYLGSTAPGAAGPRKWFHESGGLIASWRDFEAYPWPAVGEFDFSSVETLDRELRGMGSGMKLVLLCGGFFSKVTLLLGWENLAYLSVDQPDLLKAVFDRVFERRAAVYRAFVTVPTVGAVVLADDLGHRSGPMISPQMFESYCLPYYKRIAEIVHARGLPLIFHSCGKMDAFMPALIDEVGIQGKHSFEENATPVIDAHRNYGSSVAILGGVDMDRLARYGDEELRAYIRSILEACGTSGSYALGSGNGVTNYIPFKNYLALLDEWRKYRSAVAGC